MCLILVLCGLVSVSIQFAEGAAIISKRYAPDIRRSEDCEKNTSPASRNVEYYYAQDSSEYNSQSSEQYGIGMNQFTDWQNYVPSYNNYVPNIQSWQMFIPQNSWNGHFDNTYDYRPPNPDGRPGHKPWNWNPQGWHPIFQHKPWNHRPQQSYPNHNHHHNHHHPQVKPPGFEEFPDPNQGTDSSTKNPEETPSPIFPITSKPPQVTTGSTTQGGGDEDEIFDIDIRSGFGTNSN